MYSQLLTKEARAVELGGTGHHEHSFDGEVVYMPFDSHEEYEAAIESQKNYHDEEEEKEISERLKAALENKVEEHNDEVDNDPDKSTDVDTLFEVYERGIGAYRTNLGPGFDRLFRRTEQWAMARVNSYLFALRNGKFRSENTTRICCLRDTQCRQKKKKKKTHTRLTITHKAQPTMQNE